MTHDIKATLDELERLSHKAEPPSWSDRCPKFPPDPAFLDYMPPKDREFVVKLRNAMPSLLAELRRLWAKEARQDAIEEAALRYREALDVFNRQFVDRACPELAIAKQDACNALFALLDAKPSGSEEGKP